MEMFTGDYMRIDTRINVVKGIISPLKMQFDNILEINKEYNWDSWEMLYADDNEHVVGIVFIILQNYINSSLSDLYPDLTRLHQKYSVDKKIRNTQTTRIELIITLANYYKHRDLPSELHKNTARVLDDLGIKFREIYDEDNLKYHHSVGSISPIFTGLSLLSEKWDLDDLVNIVSEWRENLWLSAEVE
jgi:uncharacterized protein YeeX (DUF496 family)